MFAAMQVENNKLSKTSKTINTISEEDEFPICQVPYNKENSANDKSDDENIDEVQKVAQETYLRAKNNMIQNPTNESSMGFKMGGMGFKMGGMGESIGTPVTSGMMGMGMGMGMMGLPNNKPLGFGNCCGPPRTMSSQGIPFNPFGPSGPSGPSGPFGRTMAINPNVIGNPGNPGNPMNPIGHCIPPRNPPSYQDITQSHSQQNNQNILHINSIYVKLAEARKKIAELNKFLDEIYETLPKIN